MALKARLEARRLKLRRDQVAADQRERDEEEKENERKREDALRRLRAGGGGGLPPGGSGGSGGGNDGSGAGSGAANDNTRRARELKPANDNNPVVRSGATVAHRGPVLSAEIAKKFTQGNYTNRQATGTEVFYRYHGTNRLGKEETWVTNRKYNNEEELRRDLAILRGWTPHITKVTTIRPAKGAWISEGTAASQIAEDGEMFVGRGYQASIDSKDLPNSTIVTTEALPRSFYDK